MVSHTTHVRAKIRYYVMSARYRKKENEIIFLQYFTENKMTISVCKKFTQPCLTLILSTKNLKLNNYHNVDFSWILKNHIMQGLCLWPVIIYQKSKIHFSLQQEQALCWSSACFSKSDWPQKFLVLTLDLCGRMRYQFANC